MGKATRKPKVSGEEAEQIWGATRENVQGWLMSEGWRITEQPHPSMTWLIRAEDASQRKILIGQSKTRPDHLHLEGSVHVSDDHRKRFESLPEAKRRDALWELRFRLLAMNVEFAGVAEPMQGVVITQRIYLDGLTRDIFLQRFLTVCNAVVAVIWSMIKDLEGIEPPAESAALGSR